MATNPSATAKGDHYLEACDPLDSRQFLIAVKRLADSLSYGTDSSPFLGSGVEYVQSRQYEPGDPIKSIDWRVTARTSKFHVKEYEAPKCMPVYLLVDTSASMTVSSSPMSKYAWALQIAGGIGFAALDRVSPVGVIGVGGSDVLVKPTLSRDRILQWLHRLRHYRYDEPTTLTQRIRELAPSLGSRAMLVAITDLHDPGAVEALKLVGQKHDVITLQMRDPAEDNLRGSGFFHGQEAETGKGFVTHGRRTWLDHAEVTASLKTGGIDHLVIDTAEPFVHMIRHFFRSRGLLGKGAR
ncbi:MAG: hypothetical protein ACI8XO_001309 [Verrucomicrobiales bacterium]|jgi:uncharacterized protein (DUF58 family)